MLAVAVPSTGAAANRTARVGGCVNDHVTWCGVTGRDHERETRTGEVCTRMHILDLTRRYWVGVSEGANRLIDGWAEGWASE